MDGRSRPAPPAQIVSLLIPTHNEADTVAAAAAAADDALAELVGAHEILVIDDGSTDDTAARVEALARERPRVRLLRHDARRGYGVALRTGVADARGDAIAVADAAGHGDAADLARLLPLTRTHPVVVGRRDERPALSHTLNILARVLLGTGVHDAGCPLRVFRRDALESLLPESPGRFADAEMLARARQQRLPVVEVPVRSRPDRDRLAAADVAGTLVAAPRFWWSGVLFPGATATDSSLASRPSPLAPLLLFAFAAVLLFCRLTCPLLEPEEARYAEIPRQMLAEGRWLVPSLHGQTYLHKPPLLYWLVMAGYGLFGVHDWAARAVAAAAAWLTVVAVWWWGRWAAGPRAGLLAGAVLCLMPEFLYRGRMLTMNGLLALCVTVALAAGYRALAGSGRRVGWWAIAGVAAGLGVLAKGPVALVLAAVPLAAAACLDPRLRRPGVIGVTVFLAAAAGTAGPWFAAVAVAEPEFAYEFFWLHHVTRFVDSLDHAEPFWFYLPYLAVGTLPWALVLLPLARSLGRRRWEVASRRPAVLGVGLLAGAWAVCFFSLADCKRAVYLVPALPPLALALGCALDALVPRGRLAGAVAAVAAWRSGVARNAAAVVLALALGLAFVGLQARVGKPERLAIGAAASAGLLVAVLARRRVSWAVAGGLTCAAMFGAAHELLPGYHQRFSLRTVVRPQAETAERSAVAVYCYPRRWDSVSFYLRRDDVKAFAPHERAQLVGELAGRRRSLVFVKTQHLPELLRDLPPEVEFVAHRRTPWVTGGEVRRRGAVDAPGVALRTR
jgi:4-amino-4-deoxy-L-arabinose transferase-like glycosyltransferase